MIKRNTFEWFTALDAHVDAHSAIPFAWGENDCFTFAAGWVQIVRGDDPMAGMRGLVDAASAARALHDAGGPLAAVTSRMGPHIPGTMAQVGDVVLVRHGDRKSSLGVCLGPYVGVPGGAGLLMIPISQGEAAWRV